MRKGSEVSGLRLIDNALNSKYHLYDVRNRFRLCRCGNPYWLKSKLNIPIGFRSTEHKTNRSVWF